MRKEQLKERLQNAIVVVNINGIEGVKNLKELSERLSINK